jgi:hypothetical protein
MVEPVDAAARGGLPTFLGQPLDVADGQAVHAAVTVMDERGSSLSCMQGLLQCVQPVNRDHHIRCAHGLIHSHLVKI